MRLPEKFVGLGVVLAALCSGCYLSAFHDRQVVPDISNYWHQPTGTIHVAPDQTERVYWHEWCHGWQGEALPLNDIPLRGWKATSAGSDFNGSLEQAADVCAYTMMGVTFDGNTSERDYITEVDPSWLGWAERWVPSGEVK